MTGSCKWLNDGPPVPVGGEDERARTWVSG